jgi:hypothetical protein
MKENEASVKEVVTDREVPEAKTPQDRQHKPGFPAQIGDRRPERGESGPEDQAKNAEGHGEKFEIRNQKLEVFGPAVAGRIWKPGSSQC